MSGDVVIRTESAEQTERLAEVLATRLSEGDTVLLSGPVGAGKSVFARAVIQSLQRADGEVEDVPSPTFTLVQRYQAGGLALVHADLYRLKNSLELDEIGLLDDIGEATCLIEWPEMLPDWVAEDALAVTLEPDGRSRIITLTGKGNWPNRLAGLGFGD
jgi:tRNA threonylcarbamoyladenosine biosynthesis protein TsaE